MASDDGQKVYEEVERALRGERYVQLSFLGRETMITAFLNAAIGQLYSGKFEPAYLESHLQYVDLSGDDSEMIARAVDNAKRYFKNQRQFDKAWEHQLHDEE